MRLIGFTGAMGSGKSTAIKTLGEVLAAHPNNVKFAQPLYDIQEAVYERIADVYTRPPEFIKDRKLLQWLGSDWGRTVISPTIWVDLWKAEVQYLDNMGAALIVSDDCRFDNEAKAIHAQGGIVIKIEAYSSADRAVQGGIANHASEAGISSHLVDHVVHNNGTLVEYKESLKRLFQSLGLSAQQ